MADDLQPALIQLTGPGRGTRHSLATDQATVGIDAHGEVRVSPGEESDTADRRAVLHRGDDRWYLRVAPDAAIFLNGDPVSSGRVLPGDVIQVGPDGPLLRFRLEPGSGSQYKSLRDALADCVACARYGSDSVPAGIGLFLESMPRELFTQTAPWLRTAMVGGVLLGLAATGYQIVQSRQLEDRLANARTRLDAVAASLRAEQDRNIVTSGSLDSLRRAMEARGDEGEDGDDAAPDVPDVLAGASRSVMLIHGVFGFEDPASGRSLHAEQGWNRATSGQSSPRVSVDADGPPLERQYTGTAFAVTDRGHFITNRHLVRPWRQDPVARSVQEAGFRPVLRELIGFLPGREKPVDLKMVLESDSADLALLRTDDLEGPPAGLPLADETAQVGQTVYLLGYPTGLRALLARSSPALVTEIEQDTVARRSPRKIIDRLAEEGAISPLTTRGIVGQISPSSVVYDAETSQGGSGGPVVSRDGRVVAVNKGLMPEFGGSNLGVPVRQVRRLLDTADLQR